MVSYPTFLILSVFESEFRHKYENKYDISDIRPYPIRFHPYTHALDGFRGHEKTPD
jgi:hypothetical protein